VKCNALKRKLSFNVTKEQAYEVMQHQNFKCALTGIARLQGILEVFFKKYRRG